MSSQLFRQVVLLMVLAGIILILTVGAANPTSQSRPRQRTAAECRQMTHDVEVFTKTHESESGRERQVVHCQAGYVAFQIHVGGKYSICTAQIRVYHKGQYVPMASYDCVVTGFDRKAQRLPKYQGSGIS